MATVDADDSEPAIPNGRRRAVRWLKRLLTVGVVLAVGWHLWSRTEEWRRQREAGEIQVHVNAGWVAVSAVSYVAGLSLCGLFWRRLLADAGVSVGRVEGLRAYFIGHLGKYIPGKAWVILLRVGLLTGARGRGVTVGLTVVYETVAMMAVGAAVAGVMLIVAAPQRWIYWGGASAIAVVLGTVVHPAVFRRVAGWVTLPLRRDPGDTLPRLRYHTVVRGAGLLVGGWLLIGLSLVAVARAIGVEFEGPGDVILLIGTASLATVGGFLVLFAPSGLGPRELIVVELLSPQLGSAAVGASLLLRLVWVAAELCVAGVLYRWPRRSAKT